MAKRKFKLSEKEANELLSAYQQAKDGPTRTRYQAVRLYGLGYPTREVLAITGCSRPSLMEWCRAYRRQGPTGLVDRRQGGNRAKLTSDQIDELRARLHGYTPKELLGAEAATATGAFWTVTDLQRAVQAWYGVSYQSRVSYTQLLARCGFSYQRPAKVFKSRRPSQVAEFEELLEKNSSTLPKKPPRR